MLLGSSLKTICLALYPQDFSYVFILKNLYFTFMVMIHFEFFVESVRLRLRFINFFVCVCLLLPSSAPCELYIKQKKKKGTCHFVAPQLLSFLDGLSSCYLSQNT